MAGSRAEGSGRRGLPRGPQALPREEVVADQRRRLFEALVGLVDEHGLSGVRISELVARAGVSRRSFYEHFANKEECLLAAFDASAQRLTSAIGGAYDPQLGAHEQVHAIVAALFATTLRRPAATRLVCVDVIAAGEAGIERWARGARSFERFLCEVFARAPGEGSIPEPVAKAVVGALRKILYTRVASGQSGRALRAELERTLPQVVDWICGYYPTPPGIPPRPRRRHTTGGRSGGRVRGRAPGSLATLSRWGPRALPSGEHNLPRGFVEHNQRERIFDAIANLTAAGGYHALSLDEVAAEAAISLQTFYSHFESKEEAFAATYELGNARAVAVCVEAFVGEPEWTEGIRAALAALLALLAAEPAFARLACVDMLVAFPGLTERMEQAGSAYAQLLATGLRSAANGSAREAPPWSPIAGEAIVGGLFELVHDYVARGLTERLPELTEHAVYIALTPFVGGELAAAVARGQGGSGGRPKRGRAGPGKATASGPAR